MNEFINQISQYITPEVITIVVQSLAIITMVFKFISIAKKTIVDKDITIKDVCTEVKKVTTEVAKETTSETIKEIVSPLNDKIDTIVPVLETFSKILALSQENTPESRVAILNLIQDLGNVKNVDKSKETIINQVEVEKARKENLLLELDNLEANNNVEITRGRV